jgi:1-deoxy-D-xylulose 5-phosphate reductoisomerase
VIDATLERHNPIAVTSIETVLEADAWARREAAAQVDALA